MNGCHGSTLRGHGCPSRWRSWFVRLSKANDLSNQRQYQMLAALHQILRLDIDDICADFLGTENGNIVVLCHLKLVEGVLAARQVDESRAATSPDAHNTVYRPRIEMLNKFTDDDPVTALVENLHRVRRDGESGTNIGVRRKSRVDILGIFDSFSLIVNRM